MAVPKLLTGTLAGALVGAVVINPCNGGAAVGAVLGLFCGVLAEFGSILPPPPADNPRRDWLNSGWADRGPIVPGRVLIWIVGMMLLAFAVGWSLVP